MLNKMAAVLKALRRSQLDKYTVNNIDVKPVDVAEFKNNYEAPTHFKNTSNRIAQKKKKSIRSPQHVVKARKI